MSALAELDDLRVKFGPVAAVRGVSLEVMPGEVVCLLGESGSGKSVTMRALMRLLPPTARIEGGVRVEGQDVTAMGGKALRAVRGGVVAMVFQEPMTALDPVYTVGQQIVEAVRRHLGSTRRRRGRGRSRCWSWCGCRMRNGGWGRIRMSCRAGCGSVW